jgi:hypothetical protein
MGIEHTVPSKYDGRFDAGAMRPEAIVLLVR